LSIINIKIIFLENFRPSCTAPFLDDVVVLKWRFQVFSLLFEDFIVLRVYSIL